MLDQKVGFDRGRLIVVDGPTIGWRQSTAIEIIAINSTTVALAQPAGERAARTSCGATAAGEPNE
jgi:hypothetical protein